MTKPERRRYLRRHRARLADRGRCRHCGRALQNILKSHCTKCLEKNNLTAKARQRAYRAKGLCGCGKSLKNAGEFRSCEQCRAENRVRYLRRHRTVQYAKNQVERYWTLKAQGLCVTCGKVNALKGFVKCQRCLIEHRATVKRSYHRGA